MKGKTTLKTKILAYLQEHPTAQARDIVEGTGIKNTVLAAYLQRMKIGKLIQNVSYGKYSATPLGLSHLSEVFSTEIQTNLSENKKADDKLPKLFEMDLENIDVIFHLKQKYGKRKLLAIIEKIKKIIE